jgi:hypothetical protein
MGQATYILKAVADFGSQQLFLCLIIPLSDSIFLFSAAAAFLPF